MIKNTRISQERLGYAADINKPNLGGIKGGFSYDLYNQWVSTYYGGIEAYAGSHVMLGADIDYFVPTFDADSIWNSFTHSPITTITGRVAVEATKRFSVAANGGTRIWSTEGDPATFGAGELAACKAASPCLVVDPSYGTIQTYGQRTDIRNLATTKDFLGNLSGRYRWPSGEVGLRGMMETGSRGKREGADLSGDKRLEGGRYSLGARVSLYGWNDVTRPDRDATSFSYVLSAGWRPAKFADTRVEWEHDMNRLVGQRFRVLALINLLVMK